MSLTQTTLILDLRRDARRFAEFRPNDPDQPYADKVRVYLPAAVWEEMGRPAQITVSIRPGDTLNPEAQS